MTAPLEIVISNEVARRSASSAILNLAIEPGKQWIVRIFQKKQNRSAAQNSLYWLWMTEISDKTGYTKQELHEMCKRKHLIPILARDDEKFCEMWEAVQSANDAVLDMGVAYLVSTTGLKTKQFTEYLNDVEMEYEGQGVPLPHPEDRYYQAMGYSR